MTFYDDLEFRARHAAKRKEKPELDEFDEFEVELAIKWMYRLAIYGTIWAVIVVACCFYLDGKL